MVVNEESNLCAVDRIANRSRQDWSWDEWPGRNRYSAEALARAARKEADARATLQRLINERLRSLVRR